MKTLPNTATMFRALHDRDRSFEGLFWVGVRTTGIFCRPTCGAKKPKRENCEFFPSQSSALHAGYRPCMRCRPMDNGSPAPEWLPQLCSRIADEPWSRIRQTDLRELGLNPDRVRRHFKQHLGISFAEYQRAHALGAALRDMQDGVTAVEAGVRSGFDSTSGFREAFRRVFGEPPSEAKSAACLLCRRIESPLGPMLAIASSEGLCLLEFVERRALLREIADLRRRFRSAVVPGDNAHLKAAATQIGEYFAGTRREFSLAIDAPASPFHQRVWDRLQTIPYGETRSYAQLGRELRVPGGARAIGRANGSNRIAVVIPCHRVIRQNGELAGYAGGLWRKRWLLDHEESAVRQPKS